MSLSAHDQQALDSIEDEIAGSAPRLASLLATFARLTAGEELPGREQVGGARRRAALPARAWRRHPLPRAPRLARGPRMWPGWWLMLLWLAVSAGLVASALIISRSEGGCAVPAAACAGQVLAHAHRSGVPAAPSNWVPGRPGQANG